MGIVDCRVSLVAALLLQATSIPHSLAFSPIANTRLSSVLEPSSSADSASATRLYSVAPKEEEKVLRQEIAEKNSKIENEEEFGVIDGNIPNEEKKKKDSIVNMKEVSFVNGKPKMKQFIEDYPFPYYMVLEDMSSLPEILGDALRQWFEILAQQQLQGMR